MGTRSLVIVRYNRKDVIAQYGQYDGYPEYSLEYILNFMLESGKMNALRNMLDKGEVQMYKWEDAVKTFGKQYSGGWPTTLNSSAGCGILDLAAFARGTVYLLDSTRFAMDSLFCEWAYIVDLDKDSVEVYKGHNRIEVSKGERFYRYNRYCKKDEYKPVKLFATIRNVRSHKEDPKFVENAVNTLAQANDTPITIL